MSNYKNTFNIDDSNTSWSLAFELINDNSSVLEIGCGNGNFAEALKKYKNCTVTGIEPNKEDANLARKKVDKILSGTVEANLRKLNRKKFDHIVLLDVIEHLVDPVSVLNSLSKLLKDHGTIVFSMPNMAHVSVRLMLMGGELVYGKTGILDNTHLHFYTKKEINRVFGAAGLAIDKLVGVMDEYGDEIMRDELNAIGVLDYSRGLMDLLRSNSGSVYQYVGAAIVNGINKVNTELDEVSPNTKQPRDRGYEAKIAELESIIKDLQKQSTNTKINKK